MAFPFGALIGAGASVFGGLLQNREQNKQNRQMLKQQQKQAKKQEATVKSFNDQSRQHVLEDRASEREYAEKMYEKQREDAFTDRSRSFKQSIDDARASGISPLALLGGGGVGPFASPSMVLPSTGSASRTPPVSEASSYIPGQSNLGDIIGSAGLELGRMIEGYSRQKLEEKALLADIRYRDAATASMLAQATSRTGIAADRSSRGRMQFGPIGVRPPARSRSSQEAEDEFWEIGGGLQGIYNIFAGDWEVDGVPQRSGDPYRTERFTRENATWW